MGAPLEGSLQSEAWFVQMRPGERNFRKKVQSPPTPSSPWQLQNRSLIARDSTKKTLQHGYFPGAKNARNGMVPHHRYSFIWSKPGPCRTMLYGLCTSAEAAAG